MTPTAALMVSGIALLGIVTATLASWMVERVTGAGGSDRTATRAQIDRLVDQLAALRAEIRALRAGTPSSGSPAEGVPTRRSGVHRTGEWTAAA